MESFTWIFIGAVLILYGVVFLKSPALAGKALKCGSAGFFKAMPLIFAAFALGGILQTIIPRELFSNWLGIQRGIKGIFLGCVLGGITPGPIYFVFPLAAGLLKGGAGIGVVIAYLLAWDMWPIRRIPVEVALIGWKLVAIKFVLTLPLSLLAGLLANLFFSKVGF